MKTHVVTAVLSSILVAPLGAQEWGYPYHEQVNALMEQSVSFKTEVLPIMDRVVVNTHESLPGNNLVLLVPNNGLVTLFFDVEKITTLKVTEDEMVVILVHELYGHAVPQIRDGVKCDDPARGQYYIQSCVGRREAKVLRELGMRPRTRYTIR